MSNFKAVKEFHDTFGGIPAGEKEKLLLRERLIEEECKEVVEAIHEVKEAATVEQLAEARAHLLKECVDLLYVTYGTIHSMGWDADDAFREVHRSNMSKVGADGKPMYREDGKILKGPNFSPADMKAYVS